MAVYRYQGGIALAYPAPVPNPPGLVVVHALPAFRGFAAHPYLDVDFAIPALEPVLGALVLPGSNGIPVALLGAVLLSRLAEKVLSAVFAFLGFGFFHAALFGPDGVHGLLALLAVQLPGIGAAYRPSASLTGAAGVSPDAIAAQDAGNSAIINIQDFRDFPVGLALPHQLFQKLRVV